MRQALDAAGLPLLTQTFDPYGNPYSYAGPTESATSYGFTGEQTDSNGLVFLRARYYNPAQGRFMQMDPSRLEMNPYLYGLGNPVRYTDPSGQTVDCAPSDYCPPDDLTEIEAFLQNRTAYEYNVELANLYSGQICWLRANCVQTVDKIIAELGMVDGAFSTMIYDLVVNAGPQLKIIFDANAPNPQGGWPNSGPQIRLPTNLPVSTQFSRRDSNDVGLITLFAHEAWHALSGQYASGSAWGEFEGYAIQAVVAYEFGAADYAPWQIRVPSQAALLYAGDPRFEAQLAWETWQIGMAGSPEDTQNRREIDRYLLEFVTNFAHLSDQPASVPPRC